MPTDHPSSPAPTSSGTRHTARAGGAGGGTAPAAATPPASPQQRQRRRWGKSPHCRARRCRASLPQLPQPLEGPPCAGRLRRWAPPAAAGRAGPAAPAPGWRVAAALRRLACRPPPRRLPAAPPAARRSIWPPGGEWAGGAGEWPDGRVAIAGGGGSSPRSEAYTAVDHHPPGHCCRCCRDSRATAHLEPQVASVEHHPRAGVRAQRQRHHHARHGVGGGLAARRGRGRAPICGIPLAAAGRRRRHRRPAKV